MAKLESFLNSALKSMFDDLDVYCRASLKIARGSVSVRELAPTSEILSGALVGMVLEMGEQEEGLLVMPIEAAICLGGSMMLLPKERIQELMTQVEVDEETTLTMHEVGNLLVGTFGRVARAQTTYTPNIRLKEVLYNPDPGPLALPFKESTGVSYNFLLKTDRSDPFSCRLILPERILMSQFPEDPVWETADGGGEGAARADGQGSGYAGGAGRGGEAEMGPGWGGQGAHPPGGVHPAGGQGWGPPPPGAPPGWAPPNAPTMPGWSVPPAGPPPGWGGPPGWGTPPSGGPPGWGTPAGGPPGWGTSAGGPPGWGTPAGGPPGWGTPAGGPPGWGTPPGGSPHGWDGSAMPPGHAPPGYNPAGHREHYPGPPGSGPDDSSHQADKPPSRMALATLLANEDASGPPISLKGLHALVVDDSWVARRTLAQSLIPHGCIIHDARDAESASQVMASRRIDLILLDLMLPGESGLSFLTRLRDSGVTATTPVVVISGVATPENVVQAIRAGASFFLVKPVNDRYLQKILKGVMRQYMTSLLKSNMAG